MTDDATATGATPPAERSTPRSRFRQQRLDAAADVTHDLEVEGWKGLYARFATVGPVEIREYAEQRAAEAGNRQERRARGKVRGAKSAADAGVDMEIKVLTRACQGLYWLVDGEEISFDEEHPDLAWPRFDQRTLDIFGAAGDTAEDAVRAVYGNGVGPKAAEWRIVEAADLLIEMSKRRNAEIEDEAQGG